MDLLSKLPKEVQSLILLYLEYDEITRMCRVCKYFRNLVDELDIFWKPSEKDQCFICTENPKYARMILQKNPFRFVKKIPTSIRIVVFGDGGVGKSATVVMYTEQIFVEKYDPTIEESYNKEVKMDKKTPTMLDILDTAGVSDGFSAMTNLYIKSGDVFIILFSVIVRSTFDDIVYIISQIERVKRKKAKNIPITIVGNKIDLEDRRCVSFDEGKKVAEKLGFNYIESSAKSYELVSRMFEIVVSDYAHRFAPLKKKRKENKEKKNCIVC